jgi:predicted RNase H-like HicB family nuclease
MIALEQDIHIEQATDGRYVATVPGIGATVTGATHEEALTNAQRAIVASMIAEAERNKKGKGKGHTGA